MKAPKPSPFPLGRNILAVLDSHRKSGTKPAIPADLARALEEPNQTVNDAIYRYATMELPKLLKFASALGVSVDTLLSGVDPSYDAILQSASDQPGHTPKGQSGRTHRNTGGGNADSAETRLLREQLRIARQNLKQITAYTDLINELSRVDLGAEARRPARRQSSGGGGR